MAETLVVSLVAVPLLLLVPVVGKLQDLRHAVQMASRSVAFDATVNHPGSHGYTPHRQLSDEIRARHFAAQSPGLRTGQRPPAGSDWARPLWTDPRGNPLIGSPEDVQVGWGDAAAPRPEDGYSPASDSRLFNLVPLARASGMGLQSPGILTGGVAVPLARLPEGIRAWSPFDRIDLRFEARTSLLVDAWAARSPSEVEQRVGSLDLVPGGLAAAVARVGGLGLEALELGHVPAPRVGQLDSWRDVVPADRLREFPR